MFPEEDYIQLSSIQHYIFCKRQCALIHVEGLWAENRFTARGKIMHERADSGDDETRGDMRIARSLNIYSKRLGLSGRADVVEFKKEGGTEHPFPVEYKSGQPKRDICDLAQICAQALCLEEMTGLPVREGAIYYGRPRRRLAVELDDALRRETEDIIAAVHRMIETRTVPAAKREKKCDSCSLLEQCMPGIGEKRLATYIRGLYTIDEETS
ncbi:MAG: CRISPR-associated protein Cas4 [Spirochaetes bacterium]|nr:MAG: CRISPR-associated protein Cas4 [Spirochaetota bacterium]